jgi:hypothetical protein
MEVRSSRLKIFVIFVLTAAAAYACDFLAQNGIAARNAWFASWIFTILAAFGLWATVFSNPLRARVSPEGLLAPGISNSLIPWGDIQSISILTANGNDEVKVHLVPNSKSEQASASWPRTLSNPSKVWDWSRGDRSQRRCICHSRSKRQVSNFQAIEPCWQCQRAWCDAGLWPTRLSEAGNPPGQLLMRQIVTFFALALIIIVPIIGQRLAARYGGPVGLALLTALIVLPLLVVAWLTLMQAKDVAAAPLCLPRTPGCEMASIGVLYSYITVAVFAGLAVVFVVSGFASASSLTRSQHHK